MIISFGSTDSIAGRFDYLWTTASDDGSDDAGGTSVLGSGWSTGVEELVALLHPSLRPGGAQIAVGNSTLIDTAVHRYSDGDLAAIDDVTVRQRSGPFIEAAWQALRDTPPGAAVSYTDLACRAGRPTAIRAAASACASNAAALFVPCHRIVRRDGGLGGFRYGLEVKRILRAHEAAAAQYRSPACSVGAS